MTSFYLCNDMFEPPEKKKIRKSRHNAWHAMMASKCRVWWACCAAWRAKPL